jgi:hypothetical protein
MFPFTIKVKGTRMAFYPKQWVVLSLKISAFIKEQLIGLVIGVLAYVMFGLWNDYIINALFVLAFVISAYSVVQHASKLRPLLNPQPRSNQQAQGYSIVVLDGNKAYAIKSSQMIPLIPGCWVRKQQPQQQDRSMSTVGHYALEDDPGIDTHAVVF